MWTGSRLSVLWLLTVVCTAVAPGYAQQLPAAAELQPYSMQMHLHGWSNHNGGGFPGSMQWHSHFAQALGLDVIWWTDHVSRGLLGYGAAGRYCLGLNSAHIERGTLLVAGVDVVPVERYSVVLKPTVSGGLASASLSAGELSWQLSSPGSQFNTFSYTPRLTLDPERRIGTSRYAQPLVFQPHLKLDLDRGAVGADAIVEMLAELSWHHYGGSPVQQSVLYRFMGANATPARRLVGANQVVVNVPLAAGWQPLDLDLAADAALLPDGGDNSLQDLTWQVRSRNGATARARIRNLRVVIGGDPFPTFQSLQSVAQAHAATYGVRQYVQYEVGVARTVEVGSTHFTTFHPASPGRWPDLNVETVSSAELVSLVHRQGGILAYCHPMFPTDLAGLSQDQLVAALAANMRAYRCFGADLLEVAYPWRRGLNLNHQVELWDNLTADGLNLCAIGTSDNHGDVWESDMIPGPYVTWVWSRSKERADLINGLRRRRAYLGNPYAWQGRLDLRAGGLVMGQSGLVAGNSTELSMMLQPVPPGTVQVVQGLIRPGQPLQYLVDHVAVDPTAPVMLDTSQPSFVRVEVRSPERKLLAASNPIIMLKGPAIELREAVAEIPAGQSPKVKWQVTGQPDQTGVRWWAGAHSGHVAGRLAGLFYEAVLPTASLSGITSIRYQVTASGAGFSLTSPAEGQPALVIGVRGATPAAGAAMVVSSLSAAGTGSGCEIRMTLSAEAELTAEVLNLAGRRVRVICESKQSPAGDLILLWNRRSDRGLAVPAGRYLVAVAARTSDGRACRAMAQVSLERD